MRLAKRPEEKVCLLLVSSPANLNFIAFLLPVTGVIDCIFIARGSVSVPY